MPTVRALSIHTPYACRHSGACCTAGWAIPVEPERRARFGGTSLLTPDPNGACRYFDRSSRLCAIHRDGGHEALPVACQQFPRLSLIDGRGISVSLSHFCPTAASLLFVDAELTIVSDPPAFASAQYDGLDARGGWPPLVHASLLFDPDAYLAWETLVVSTLAERGNPMSALRTIAGVAERVRQWTPCDGPMSRLIQRVVEPDSDGSVDPLAWYATFDRDAYEIVARTVPDGLRRPVVASQSSDRSEDGWEPFWPVVRRYLAAKSFASWTAYQGRGIRTLVAELVVAHSLLKRLAHARAESAGDRVNGRSLHAALRDADHLLVHLADRQALVRALDAAELCDNTRRRRNENSRPRRPADAPGLVDD